VNRVKQTTLWICLLVHLVGTPAVGVTPGGRVLVIGMDGMDPVLLERYMQQDKLPHFKRLAATGDFKPLATSMPPQSPVAWSNVICGGLPGTHQIFDFIHRDPNPPQAGSTLRPYLSTNTIESPAKSRMLSWLPDQVPLLASFGWCIPLSAPPVPKLRRAGPAFWEGLVGGGVDTAIYRIPANYPAEPVEGSGSFHCLAGMGTPDLLGSYGEFTVFTSHLEDPLAQMKQVSGGRFVRLELEDDRATALIEGPANFLRCADKSGEPPPLTASFEVVRDPQRELVKITLGARRLILATGEWSPWVQFVFETGLPGSAVIDPLGAPTSVPGMVRFYVKSVHPALELFVTPVNIDPTRPANAISTPHCFANDLAHATGLYFTAGIPEHTPEIQQGALNEDQWLEKANMILDERAAQFGHALDHFESGFLFYYFGTPDLVSHIFWRDQDPDHPGRDPQQGDRYAQVIEQTYARMDAIVGQAMDVLGEGDTLIVMSDHGFDSFRWQFNLNTWLLEHGYITLRNPSLSKRRDLFAHADWSKTKAYALGLNGLYVNQRGREKFGIVAPGAEARKLLEQIEAELLAFRDAEGRAVVEKIYDVSREYPGADPAVAPDALVGYARTFRASWATVLGGMPRPLVEVNTNRWSGDHCIAAHLVPGILLANRRITVEKPTLSDVAPTVLGLFSLEAPAQMTGRMVLERRGE